MAEMAVGRDKDMTDMIAQMTLHDWLDDLTVRFLLNLPPAELSSVPRLCFQVEEAQWFYEDFIRPANPTLPSLNLRQFCLVLFQHCPLLSGFNAAQHLAAYEEFLAYKVRVPVRGAILMDYSMDKVLLVRGWKKGASWSFPRGKINKDEDDLDCAAREVYEETGFDVKSAGLVQANEEADGKVKSITLTMREQHMQLFVFRGVSLDTHFEPKTRKEISKIQWYNVRDLPGYKKQKGVTGHGQGAAQTSKFYMVAPFMGHLKKWIGLQRKKDAATVQAGHQRNLSVNDAFQVATTEDEGLDTEAGFTTDNGLPIPASDRSANELKRLLSIGGPSAAPIPVITPAQPAIAQNVLHSSNLLAMLKGSQHAGITGDIPHTPFEQVDPPIPSQEPGTPQNYHDRHSSSGVQQQHQMPPQFPYSPNRLQQEHIPRHGSLPAAALFGPGSNQSSQPHQPGIANLPPHIQHHMLQQQPRQHSLPANSMPGYFPGPQFNQQNIPPSQFAAQPTQTRPASQQYLSGVSGPPGQLSSPMQPFSNTGRPHSRPLSQAPIGSDAAVPEPAKLPAPQLNAHSMKLLDAFKGPSNGGKAAHASITGVSNGQRSGSQQQETLLDLFRKKPVTQEPVPSDAEPVPPAPPSPTLTDATEKPAPTRKMERRPTLNEITRTLPAKVEPEPALSPIPVVQKPIQIATRPQKAGRTQNPGQGPVSSRKSAQPAQSAMPHDVLGERPKSLGQLYDPGKSQKSARVSSNAEQTPTQVSILPRPASRHASRSPKPSPKPSPISKTKSTQPENGHPVPQFSILQRPGSSAGKGPRSPVVHSPLRHEAPKSSLQPQVLKRPSAETQEPVEVDKSKDINVRTPTAGVGKKDQLLALFGSKPAASSPILTTGSALSNETAQETASVPVVEEGLDTIAPPGHMAMPDPSNDSNVNRGAIPTGIAVRDTSVSSSSNWVPHGTRGPANISRTIQPQQQRDQLLGLFNGSKTRSAVPFASPAPASDTQVLPGDSHQSLFNGNTAEIAIKTPEPPPSPQLQPERKPSRQNQRLENPQHHLLNLFTKPNSVSGMHSPGTPISPFSLGTPASREPPLIGRLPGTAYDSSAYASDASTAGIAAPRSRLGSMASVLSNGGGSGQQTPTESVSTPTEAKNMLLGYLNGVVQKEGYRSAKRN